MLAIPWVAEFGEQPNSMPELADEDTSAERVAADWGFEWLTEHSAPGPRRAVPVSRSAKATQEYNYVTLQINFFFPYNYRKVAENHFMINDLWQFLFAIVAGQHIVNDDQPKG